jgi:hypothetical protein
MQESGVTGLFTNHTVDQLHAFLDGVVVVKPLHLNFLVSFCNRSQKSVQSVEKMPLTAMLQT